MVIPYKYEDKFHNGDLVIGLSLDGKEVQGSNYKRIMLRNLCFKKIGNHYENIREFGFPESVSEWGVVNGCLCFDNEKIISVGETEKRRYVGTRTTVVFEPGNFKIWFNE